MTQFFDDAGRVHPATAISVLPGTVVGERTVDRDGYQALSIGFGTKRASRVAKAQKVEWEGLDLFSIIREIQGSDLPSFEKGAAWIGLENLTLGEKVTIAGISKGKGFQGVVKRHGFHGGRRSHGQKHSEREPGSIGGAGRAGGRVAKGMKMGGRMGGDRITVKGLKVLAIDTANNLLLVKGAVPGRRGTVVEIMGN